MRYLDANKAAAPKQTKCHYCGRPVTPRSCRQELLGWFCWQLGLILGEGVQLFTSEPEPEPEPWKNDPILIRAAAEETAAEQEYDTATTNWLNTITAITEHRLTTVLHPRDGWISPDSQSLTSDDRRRRQLAGDENKARRRREQAGLTLTAARVARNAAENKARVTHRIQERASDQPETITTGSI